MTLTYNPFWVRSVLQSVESLLGGFSTTDQEVGDRRQNMRLPPASVALSQFWVYPPGSLPSSSGTVAAGPPASSWPRWYLVTLTLADLYPVSLCSFSSSHHMSVSLSMLQLKRWLLNFPGLLHTPVYPPLGSLHHLLPSQDPCWSVPGHGFVEQVQSGLVDGQEDGHQAYFSSNHSYFL